MSSAPKYYVDLYVMAHIDIKLSSKYMKYDSVHVNRRKNTQNKKSSLKIFILSRPFHHFRFDRVLMVQSAFHELPYKGMIGNFRNFRTHRGDN